MRLWLRKKENPTALHEWTGEDTACKSIQFRGMKIENFEVTGKPYDQERICCYCQTAIADRRDRL